VPRTQRSDSAANASANASAAVVGAIIPFEDRLVFGSIGGFALRTNRAPEAYREKVLLFTLEQR
jgi:hypothetical protein